MLRKWIPIVATLVAVFVVTCPVRGNAQEAEPWYTFNIGGGYSPLVGQITNRLDNGWHMTAGLGVRARSHFELNGQFTYHGLGVKPLVLSEAGVPSADSHLWSITADPKIRIGGARRFDPYLVGDVGYFRRVVNFTAPTVEPVTLFDPFFGVLFPALIPANVRLASVTRSGIGGGGGVGFNFRLGASRTKLYIEARYQYAATGTIPTRMIPATIGLSW
jgi:outer membrane protein with beta-barrel domain